MALIPRLGRFATIVASIPLVLPGSMQPASAGESVRSRLVSKMHVAEPKPFDVVLLPGNVISGEVISADGIPQPEVEVVVSVGRHEVSRATTNQAGEFAVKVPRGGAYVIASGTSASVVRAWTATAVPPHALHRVTLAPQATIIRAQGPVGGGVNPLLGLLLVGGIAAAIAIPVALNNRDDDAPANNNTESENNDDQNLLPASP